LGKRRQVLIPERVLRRSTRTRAANTPASSSSGCWPTTASKAGQVHTALSYGAIAFSGTTSSDPDGSIASYAWAFGDGSTGSGATPAHSYAGVGTYTVTLAVTDNGGFTATASTTAMVSTGSNPQPPVSRPGGPYGGTASGAQVLHAYATAGTYTVTLSVTDDAGLTTSATTTATITAAANEGATLYSLNCADCHGNDPRGGRTGERVVGAGANSIHEAIGEARAMRYLDCLPDGDVSQVSAYLKGLAARGIAISGQADFQGTGSAARCGRAEVWRTAPSRFRTVRRATNTRCRTPCRHPRRAGPGR
jgi:chitodextrinase